ncbi:hypothetical protein [Streptomyces sp. 1222.5]|uniref:hypothetical protein n=1 Tax=Streptomyces sp. 1222.5 TaxID=1881026 RepID=UPI003EBABD13
MNKPPKPGKGLSVKVDAQLYDDLSTLMRTGMTQSDAVRLAVAVLADGYRGAWESGRIPSDVTPQITHVMVRRYDGPRGAGMTPDATVIRRGGEGR